MGGGNLQIHQLKYLKLLKKRKSRASENDNEKETEVAAECAEEEKDARVIVLLVQKNSKNYT